MFLKLNTIDIVDHLILCLGGILFCALYDI